MPTESSTADADKESISDADRQFLTRKIRKPRRQFLATSTALAATCMTSVSPAQQQDTAQQSDNAQQSVRVELPRMRVPLSFIIDDSTCLVNMGKFCMPQFAATYPQRKDYQKPWQQWPDEIPDAFVRDFGSWCAEQGVKGKYSIVPYPACVGWMDRTLPGWSQQQLRESLKLVRTLMLPNWDIHPEMISHTRVIDLKTGRPFADYSPKHMENSYPQEDVSVDYLASYLAYALQILKNCDLPCEGITTPGGFGSRVTDKLPWAVREAVRDVYGTQIPHYFKYVRTVEEGTLPSVEAESTTSLSTEPDFVMNVPAGTGDWFGGWDGASKSEGTKYCNEDATEGRMVELIEARQPAVMLCHWPGMYCGGTLEGYRDFQRVVTALHRRFSSNTIWMKVSEIGRYWAAKHATTWQIASESIQLTAPLDCKDFTIRLPARASQLTLETSDKSIRLKSVSTEASLTSGSFLAGGQSSVACFDLPAGECTLRWSGA